MANLKHNLRHVHSHLDLVSIRSFLACFQSKISLTCVVGASPLCNHLKFFDSFIKPGWTAWLCLEVEEKDADNKEADRRSSLSVCHLSGARYVGNVLGKTQVDLDKATPVTCSKMQWSDFNVPRSAWNGDPDSDVWESHPSVLTCSRFSVLSFDSLRAAVARQPLTPTCPFNIMHPTAGQAATKGYV